MDIKKKREDIKRNTKKNPDKKEKKNTRKQSFER